LDGSRKLSCLRIARPHPCTRLDEELSHATQELVGRLQLPDRSDGGGATVGRANFDVFTATKNIDTATTKLVEFCCKGTAVKRIVLHLFRAGEGSETTGVVKYAMIVFGSCVITKVAVSGGGEELPKESLEFNYGACEYMYQETDHDTGKPKDGVKPAKAGWSTVKNKYVTSGQAFDAFEASSGEWS